MKSNITDNDSVGVGAEPFTNTKEGPTMLIIGILGTLLNIIFLRVLSHKEELKLAPDYLCLLRSQSFFDLLYILTSTPVTALPYIDNQFMLGQLPFILPWIFPFMQIAMLASIYNIVALAVERYLSIRDISVTHSFPCRITILGIIVCSFAVNIPRFFELRPVAEEESDLQKINNTGILHKDYILVTTVRHTVKPTAEFNTLGYFLGYNMIGSFLISLFIPVVTLTFFNLLIWKRLQQIWQNQHNLGVQEKRNTMAALSLVLLVIMFFLCHSMKLVISGYQLVDSIITPDIRKAWPPWVEICTFISHFLLALNASVTILIFCSCDKRFFTVVRKMAKACFMWMLNLDFIHKMMHAEEVNLEMGEIEVEEL